MFNEQLVDGLFYERSLPFPPFSFKNAALNGIPEIVEYEREKNSILKTFRTVGK